MDMNIERGIDQIRQKFEIIGYPLETYEQEGTTFLIGSIQGNEDVYPFLFTQDDDDGLAGVRLITDALFRSQAPKLGKVLERINDLQMRDVFFKFMLDSENAIRVGYDFPPDCPDIGELAPGLVQQLASFLDKNLPELREIA